MGSDTGGVSAVTDWAEEKARRILDEWASECCQEAMMSMDTAYLKRLGERGDFIGIVADVWVEHVAQGLRVAADGVERLRVENERLRFENEHLLNSVMTSEADPDNG